MRIEPVRMFIERGLLGGLVAVSLALGLTSCTSPEARDLQRASREYEKKHYRIALSFIDRVIKRDREGEWALKAAREGVKISIYEVKDYRKAVGYLRHLVLNSSDPSELEQAQQQLADIYFENLSDFAKAYAELSKLLAMKTSFIDRSRIQIKMARSSFYLGDFAQAESEIETVLKNPMEPSARFHALTLKGNILVAQKDFVSAAEMYRLVMREFPEEAPKENVPLQLAVCYEEDKKYKEAIAVLEGMRETYKPPEYIELRIKRLREKMKNQPGARGFRK